MPLYQAVGNDGYFLVREVPGWALRLSAVLRKINFENFLDLAARGFPQQRPGGGSGG